MAVVQLLSAPMARVDIAGQAPFIRRQEGVVSLIPNAMVGANIQCGAGHG